MDFLINDLPLIVIAAAAVYGAIMLTKFYRRKPRKRAMVEHKLSIKKIGEIWQVHDTAKQALAGPLVVAAGDTVTWTIDDDGTGIAAELSFPSIVFEEIRIEDVDRRVSAGNSLTLRVSPKAPIGRYPYAVFMGEGQCAEGGSHTEIHVGPW